MPLYLFGHNYFAETQIKNNTENINDARKWLLNYLILLKEINFVFQTLHNDDCLLWFKFIYH